MRRLIPATALITLTLIGGSTAAEPRQPERIGQQEPSPVPPPVAPENCVAPKSQQPDELCQRLFETILPPGKVETSTRRAAVILIAERGRRNGFWKTVLAELKRSEGYAEQWCVQILGRMLADDARARDAIEARNQGGSPRQAFPAVYLGPEVVATLIERAEQTDRGEIDHYVIALARSRTPKARDFFKSILYETNGTDDALGAVGTEGTPPGSPFSDIPGADVPDAPDDVPAAFPGGPHYGTSTRFHAAVGLAQLGAPAGIEWLIAHCGDRHRNGSVWHAWPRGAADSSNLNKCCVAALRQLSGEEDLTTKAQWQDWWNSVEKKIPSCRAVSLVGPCVR